MKGGTEVSLKRTCQKWLVVIMAFLCIGGSVALPHVVWADPVNQAGTSINNRDSKGNKKDDYSNQSKAHEDKEKKDKDEEVEAGQWLNTAMENDNKWVQFCDLFTWAGHGIGWAIVRIVYTLSQGAENIIDSIFTLGGLLEDPSIVNITTKIQLLGFGVMALVLLFLFFKWMTGKSVDMKNVMIQMILGTCLIFATTNFVVQGLDTAGGSDLYSWAFNLSKQNYNGFKDDSYFEKGSLTNDATASDKKGESSSFNAIKANTMDLQYVLAKGNAKDLEPSKDGKFKGTGVNDLTPSDFRVLDMLQLLKDPEKIADSSNRDNKTIGKYLNYRVDKDKDGNYVGEKIPKFLKFFPQGYFRFGFHFSRIIVTLLVMTVAFVLAAFNIGSTILELVFLKILSPITIASDIETGKRMKQILMDIWKAWLTITLTGFSLSLFTRIFSFISGLDLGILAYTIALLVSAKVCYDGSNMIKKYFGADVGVQSGWKTLMGVSSVAHMAHDGASAVSSGAHAVASGIGQLKDKLSGDSSDHGQELDQEDQKATHSSGKSSGEEALDREDGFDLKDFEDGEVMSQEKDALDSTNNDEDKDGVSEDDMSPLESISDDELDTLSDPTDDVDSDETETDELDQDPMMNGATEDIDALDDDEDQDNDTISATADMDNQLGDEWDMEDQPTNITEMDDNLDNDTIQADNQMEDTFNQSNLDQSPLNQDIQESISEASPNIDETANTMDHVDSMNQESASQVMNENHSAALNSVADVAHSSESTSAFQPSSHVVTPDGHDSSISPSANMTIGTHDIPVDNSSSLTSMAMDQAKSMDDIFSAENMNQYIHRPYHHSVSNGIAGKADNPNLEDK